MNNTKQNTTGIHKICAIQFKAFNILPTSVFSNSFIYNQATKIDNGTIIEMNIGFIIQL